MASTAPNTSAFMAQLLAPLSEGAEPVDAKEFVRTLKEEGRDLWYVARFRAEIAYHRTIAAQAEGCMVRVMHLEPSRERTDKQEAATFATLIEAIDRAMRLRSPIAGIAKEKAVLLRAWTKGIHGEGWPTMKAKLLEWQAAIEADQRRFGARS